MALGPLGRIIAQGVVAGIAVLARALPAAYAQALQNAKKTGADRAAHEAAKKGASFLGKARIQKDEALMVLNLTEKEALTAEAVQTQYDRYFAANAVEKGGSFYLQSKIYRAKELLDDYVKEKNAEQMKEEGKSQTGGQSSGGEQENQEPKSDK